MPQSSSWVWPVLCLWEDSWDVAYFGVKEDFS
jgi:hypothetical protein